MLVKLLSPGAIDQSERAALISTESSIFLTAPTADSLANQQVLLINDPTPATPTSPLRCSSFHFIRMLVKSVFLLLLYDCVTTEVGSFRVKTCGTLGRWPAVLVSRLLASTPATGGFRQVNPAATLAVIGRSNPELEAEPNEGCLITDCLALNL